MAKGGHRINLSPLERGLSLTLGALAGSAAIRKRTPMGALLAAASGYLLYRGVTGRCRVYRALGVSGSEVGSTVSACSQVTVQPSAGQVYRHLRDLSNLHLFSSYIENAEKLDAERWRVILRTPLGNERTLEIRRTADEENRRLAWCTVEEADFPAALELRFSEGRGGTEIHADAWLVPPTAPIVAAALRRAEHSRPLRRAGLSPSELLEQELRRLRQLLEAGETATVEGQSAGGRRARFGANADSRRRELAGGGWK